MFLHVQADVWVLVCWDKESKEQNIYFFVLLLNVFSLIFFSKNNSLIVCMYIFLFDNGEF